MKKAIVSAALMAVAITSTPALASGSGSGSRGGGFGSGANVPQVSEEDRLIRRGQSQVKKRITCKKCEYHKRLNRQTASEVANGVRNGKFNLKDRDRTAVLYFLRSRYGV